MSTRRNDSLAQHPSLLLTRRRALTLGAGLSLASAFAPAALAQTQLKVDIRQHPADPDRRSALCARSSPADNDAAAGITQVITNNLKRSGLFAPIDPAAYIEKITNIDVVPQFQSWRTINAQVAGHRPRHAPGRWPAEG